MEDMFLHFSNTCYISHLFDMHIFFLCIFHFLFIHSFIDISIFTISSSWVDFSHFSNIFFHLPNLKFLFHAACIFFLCLYVVDPFSLCKTCSFHLCTFFPTKPFSLILFMHFAFCIHCCCIHTGLQAPAVFILQFFRVVPALWHCSFVFHPIILVVWHAISRCMATMHCCLPPCVQGWHSAVSPRLVLDVGEGWTGLFYTRCVTCLRRARQWHKLVVALGICDTPATVDLLSPFGLLFTNSLIDEFWVAYL